MAKKSTTEDLKRGIAKIRIGKTGGRAGSSSGEFAKRVSRDLRWNAQQTGERMSKAGSRRGYNQVSYQDKHQLQYPLSKGEIARAGGIVPAYNARAVDSSRITAEDMDESSRKVARRVSPSVDAAYSMNRGSRSLASRSGELGDQKERERIAEGKRRQEQDERARTYEKRTGKPYSDQLKLKARNDNLRTTSMLQAGSGVRSASQNLASDMSAKMRAARDVVGSKREPWNYNNAERRSIRNAQAEATDKRNKGRR